MKKENIRVTYLKVGGFAGVLVGKLEILVFGKVSFSIIFIPIYLFPCTYVILML